MSEGSRAIAVVEKAVDRAGTILRRLAPLARETLKRNMQAPVASHAVPPKTRATFDTVMAEASGFSAWHMRRQGRSLQMTEQVSAGSIEALCTDSARHALAVADKIAAHRFNFLGSGEFQPIDPERPQRQSGYRPIDWFLDPVRGLRFSRDVPYKAWNLFAMRPANADIKYPWELARCQHFLPLGQAYRLSGNARYAHELVEQCLDFIEANPVGIGINWTCTMDVALRAANWCFALNLVAACAEIEERTWETIYRHLFETGVFILDNLENKYEVTSNHFLSNVIGIHVLSAEFEGLSFAEKWDAYAREALEEEIVAQVLPDGADYESSVPYHRLVTELFLGSLRISEIQQRPLSQAYRQQLSAMMTFLEAVMRPDGTLPVIGDADDGRLVIATGYGVWRPGDARHILAPAAMALSRPELLANADEHAAWEAAWWGFEPAETKTALKKTAGAERRSVERLFPDAGLAVSCPADRSSYLLVSNAVVGTKGFGNHKHNDLLSFEYGDRGLMLIVDPGSYVYTSDFDQRNAYRATARHNTLMVDGVEQNEFQPGYLFRMFAKATPQHIAFTATGNGIRYVGAHDGYQNQIDPGVAHRRNFDQSRRDARLEIRDVVSGEGTHLLEWYFHLAPEVGLEISTDRRAAHLSRDGYRWRFSWDASGLEVAAVHSAVSPSYGLAFPAMALRLRGTVELGPSDFEVGFMLARAEVEL